MTGFWKVFAAIALAAAVALAVMGTLAFDQLTELGASATRRELAGHAALLAAACRAPLERGDSPAQLGVELPDLLSRAASLAPGRRFTIVLPDGTVVADTHERAQDMDNHATRPEILAARCPHEPVLRWSRTLGVDMLYDALPIESADGSLLGYARVAIPADDLAAEHASLRSALLLSAGVALALGALAALILARGVNRPMQRITTFVDGVARGETAERLPVSGQGELSGLASAVNIMADRLDERFQRILRDQTELLAVLSSMTEGVLATDASQRIVLLNAAAATILEVPPGQARGRPVWEVTRTLEIVDVIARCLAQGRIATGEALLVGDNHDRVLRLTASPLADDHGPWGCVLVLQDLTEVRRLELVRRDFVTNVSHELKTPLTSMRGFVEAVLDEPDMVPATRTRFLQRARENTDRMVAIVSDLLSLARIEAEDGALQLQPLDLREIAASCHEDASSAAALRRIQLQAGLPGTEVPVLGDRTALATAITNLLDNAIKYSPEDSRVRLELGTTAPSGAEGSPGGEAWVEVSDTGPGIPAHETERIFERFYRVDKNRSRELGGTGLGLSIVRHVARAHGGRASVQSTLGRGSSFRITIPLRTAGAAPGAPQAAGLALPSGPATLAPATGPRTKSAPAPGAPATRASPTESP